MLHLDRNGDEAPARTRGNRGTHDLALETQLFGHIDIAQLWNVEHMPVDRKLIVGEVESQPILFLALEARETCFLAILAWMLELRLCPFPFHAPIVSKGLPQIGKRLFRSTLRG